MPCDARVRSELNAARIYYNNNYVIMYMGELLDYCVSDGTINKIIKSVQQQSSSN